MAFNPYLQTDLRDVKAQGANTGDYRDFNGQKFRWDGVNWNPEQSSSGPSLGSSSGSFSNTGNFEDAIRRSIEMMKEANKPAVDSLQASIPETQQKYATTRSQLQAREQPLKERYSNLIASIKGQGEQDITNQTRITNNELGKRGIVGSSTLADQEIQNATSPLRQKYAGLEKDAALGQEESLMNLQNQISNLTNDETGALRAINAAIANLQSGANQSGISLGTDIYKTSLANALQQQQQQEAARQTAIENALRQSTFDFQKSQAASDEAFRQKQLALSQANKGGSNDLASLFSSLGIGNVAGAKTSTAKPNFAVPASQRRLPQVGGGLRR
jgi:hypothetical protein